MFAPDVVHVWSLHGLSKSLLLTLRRTRVPVCFDVADPWLAEELRTDPWLAWWHSEKLSTLQKMQRTGLEWLFRLVKEPKRLFWRYAVTNPLAIFLLLTRTTSLQAAQ